MANYTKKMQPIAAGVLQPGEILLAGCRANAKGDYERRSRRRCLRLDRRSCSGGGHAEQGRERGGRRRREQLITPSHRLL